MRFKAVIIALLSIIVAVVSIQNAAVVDLDFLMWHFQISRILLILISFAIGMVVGFLLSLKKPKKKEQSHNPKRAVAPPAQR